MDIKPEFHGICTYHGMPVEDVPEQLVDTDSLAVLKDWNEFDGVAAAEAAAKESAAKEKQLHAVRVMCHHIINNNQFSMVQDQYDFEVSVVNSIYERTADGRLPTEAQFDKLKKLYNRKGPVSFAGKRGTFHFQNGGE